MQNSAPPGLFVLPFCFHFNGQVRHTLQLPSSRSPRKKQGGRARRVAGKLRRCRPNAQPIQIQNTNNFRYRQFLSSPSAFYYDSCTLALPLVSLLQYSNSVKAVPLTAYSLLLSQVNTNKYNYNAALPSNRRALRQPDLGPRSQRHQRPPCLRCKSPPSRASVQSHEQNG